MKNIKQRALIAVAILAGAYFALGGLPVGAASLSNSYVRLDRMTAATATSVQIVFKTSASNGASMARLYIDFDKANGASWTVNTTQTASSASCAASTGATALPGTLAATGDNTDKSVLITGITGAANSTQYCVDLTSSTAVTTPSAGQYTGTLTTRDGSGTDLDTLDVAERVIANDQITVTAVVPPSFNMVFTANSDAVPTINTGTASVSTGVDITLSTNAANGWVAWVKSLNSGLKSATAGNYTISSTGAGAAPHVVGPSADDYGVDGAITTDNGNGTPSVAANYNGNGTTTAGGVDSSFRKIASSTGTASGDVLTVKELASAGGETPAGNDYTDKLTLVGAGTF